MNMTYKEYEVILTPSRMARYREACCCNDELAMELYFRNILLAETLFGVISLFEVALRNAIDAHYSSTHSNPDWLRDAAQVGGQFDNRGCARMQDIIQYAIRTKLSRRYDKEQLIAECEMGVWRYLFARNQYRAMGGTLVDIFSARPKMVGEQAFDYQFVFNELGKINEMRNRIAHHEPICFKRGNEGETVVSTKQARYIYGHMLSFLTWMGIDSREFIAKIDSVEDECDKIDNLSQRIEKRRDIKGTNPADEAETNIAGNKDGAKVQHFFDMCKFLVKKIVFLVKNVKIQTKLTQNH